MTLVCHRPLLFIIYLSSERGVTNIFIIFAESSPSAVIAAVHLGRAWASQIRRTIKIAFLPVESFLYRSCKPVCCLSGLDSTMTPHQLDFECSKSVAKESGSIET